MENKQTALWRSTNYHQHVQAEDFIELENGKWYEIGHRNQFSEDFVHQGIKQYDNGFFDDGYHLKPFPTHAKEIILSIPIGEHTRFIKNESYLEEKQIGYEYEMFFKSEPDDFCKIDGWYPIETDRIKKPENIEKYIKSGLLRKIK